MEDDPIQLERLGRLVDEARAMTGARAAALSLTAEPAAPDRQAFIALSPRQADLPAQATRFADACRHRRAVSAPAVDVGYSGGHWSGVPLADDHDGICGLLHLYGDEPMAAPALDHARLLARLAAATVAASQARKRLEELQAEVVQRDALLRESHHRITNNIASVASILQMQARSQTTPEVRQQLLEAAGRVHTFGRIHESLYRSGEVETIAVGEHLSGLLNEVAATGWTKSQTPPKVEVICPPEARLPTKAATPLSLIAVELVINALKHAGAPDKHLRISVSFEMGEDIILRVTDNGPGFASLELQDRPSFGLTLVEALSRQLGGRITLGSAAEGTGAAVVVTLPAAASD